MDPKITLITPPDIFQNNQDSILLIDLPDSEQDEVSAWLADKKLNINVYFYQGEPNVMWLLHALSCATYSYINLNNMSTISSYLVGYILSKPRAFYSTDNVNVGELFSYINHNQVNNAVDFLKGIFSGQ